MITPARTLNPSGRSLRAIAWCLIPFAFLFLLSACGKEPSVEQQVIASLETMEADAEEGHFVDFMSHVAKNFKGQQGQLGRQDFQRFMMLQINKNRRVYATFFPIKVIGTPALEGEPEATATFRLLVTGGEGFLPERGQLFDVSTSWVREGGDWLLLGADWEAAQIAE